MVARTNNERFASSFGAHATTLSPLYNDLKKKHQNLDVKNFLMVMNTLTHYMPEADMVGPWSMHEQTCQKNGKRILLELQR